MPGGDGVGGDDGRREGAEDGNEGDDMEEKWEKDDNEEEGGRDGGLKGSWIITKPPDKDRGQLELSFHWWFNPELNPHFFEDEDDGYPGEPRWLYLSNIVCTLCENAKIHNNPSINTLSCPRSPPERAAYRGDPGDGSVANGPFSAKQTRRH